MRSENLKLKPLNTVWPMEMGPNWLSGRVGD